MHHSVKTPAKGSREGSENICSTGEKPSVPLSVLVLMRKQKASSDETAIIIRASLFSIGEAGSRLSDFPLLHLLLGLAAGQLAAVASCFCHH